MSKEEILTKIANDHSYTDWGEYMYDTHPHTQIEAACEVMDEYAEQQCIAFAEWCSDNNYIYVDKTIWFHAFNKGDLPTTKELYQLFIKEQNSKV